MAQFDVHPNPGVRSRHIPFVVIVQSRRLDRSRRRVVVPLVDKGLFGRVDEPRLNPAFSILGREVVFDPLQIVSVAAEALDPAVASLEEYADDIIASLDIVITRGYG